MATPYKNKFEQVRIELRDTNRDFAARIGIQESAYSKLKKDELPIGELTKNKIKDAFPNYNLEWLLYGTEPRYKISGDKLKKVLISKGFTNKQAAEKLGIGLQSLNAWMELSELSENIISMVKSSLNIDLIAIKETPYDNITLIEAKPVKPSGIPYYDIEISAGDISFYQDLEESPAYYMDIPFFSDCDLSMPVYGDSMYPKIKNGDIVLLKKIHDHSIISYGEIHLVVTSEQRLLKYVRKHKDPSKILLLSENERYDEIEVDRDKVKHLFIYKGKIEKSQI